MNNESEYRDTALTGLMQAISNRRLIQHLRLKLFRKSDFKPEDLEPLNLRNSEIEQDLFTDIFITTTDILELLEENVFIYRKYFIPRPQFNQTNVRDLFLPGEEDYFGWEIFYAEYLRKFYEDHRRKTNDIIGYYQKIYEFIMLDLTYDNEYELYV